MDAKYWYVLKRQQCSIYTGFVETGFVSTDKKWGSVLVNVIIQTNTIWATYNSAHTVLLSVQTSCE